MSGNNKNIDFNKVKKTWGIYDKNQKKPFRLSRSKIDMFYNCPRCFYLDRRLGVKQPSIPSFTLNNAVDTLLKKEFDKHRAEKSAHQIMLDHGLNQLYPFQHSDLDKWRENFVGISYLVKELNFEIFGAVDDIWTDDQGRIFVVDYKSTAKEQGIDMNDKWKAGYKRQLEVYQWLLARNGFRVSKTAFFVYVNGDLTRKNFENKLEFEMFLFPYNGDPSWIDPILKKIHDCLNSDNLPDSNPECEYCNYRKLASQFE